jgi:hypothetical protein
MLESNDTTNPNRKKFAPLCFRLINKQNEILLFWIFFTSRPLKLGPFTPSWETLQTLPGATAMNVLFMTVNV